MSQCMEDERIMSAPYLKKEKNILYIIDHLNWSVKWDGLKLAKKIKEIDVIANYQLSELNPENKIIHFGTIRVYPGKEKLQAFKRNNRLVFTWFHIVDSKDPVKIIPELSNIVDVIHTSCEITKKKLIKYGADEKKIIVIPIPVDLEQFYPVDEREKAKTKKELNLPEDKIIIGSFHKDGVGFEEGLEPKREKGPDVLSDSVIKLSRKYPIHVLLTAPARGYVKNRLKEAGISYTHTYLKHYQDIARHYHALDLYVVASREEGGPKGVLESMACGVPLVSTKVGMAPEIVQNGVNAFIAEVDDTKQIVEYASDIFNDETLKNKLITNGLETAKKYSLEKIAKEYCEKIYNRLL